jgi:protoporphyrinogen oxidase
MKKNWIDVMTKVVIIGGGLTGLAAAYELEQQHISYTLIEVKGRLGGSIVSERRDGFVLDGGPMAIPGAGDWPLLAELGLADAVYSLGEQPGGGYFAFKAGTQALVDALSKRLTGTVMRRMAVSSLGEIEGQFAICLENGLMLTTRALIVAAPARYVERMFRTLQPEISERLFNYTYDSITRVSLGYRCDAMGFPPELPWDMAIASFHWTDHASRVPSDHLLLQLGIRIPRERSTPDVLLNTLQTELNWPTPVVTRVDTWPEADPLTCLMPGHAANMKAIEHLLPDGVALVGSDYRAHTLEQRIIQGREAARKNAAWVSGTQT